MNNSAYNSAYPSTNQYTHPMNQYTYPAHVSTPVINVPAPQYPQPYPPPNSGAWTTGLCSCLDDCSTCCLGCWCPCVLVGKSVEAIDEGAVSCAVGGGYFFLLHCLTGCGCLFTCIYRNRLRDKYGLPGSLCGDFCTDCWCLECSICQVYREIENRKIRSFASGSAHPAAASVPDFQYMTK